VTAKLLRWAQARRTQGTVGWRGTDALARAAVCGFGMIAVGVLVHQLDLVLIGTPLLASAALALAAAPKKAPAVRADALPGIVESGQSRPLALRCDTGPGTELLAIRLPAAVDDAKVGPVHLVPADVGVVRTRLRWRAWGEGVDIRPDHMVGGLDGLTVFGPVTGTEARRIVLPPVLPLPSGPLPPRSAGLVGVHKARPPGDGTELRDIRPYRPGDRLRRIDWRVSLRATAAAGGAFAPGTVHVRERHAEAEAELMLALDTRYDVDAQVGEWSVGVPGTGIRPGGSLDNGARAVTAFAAAYLRQGDQVGLADLGRPVFGVPCGSGRRQLDRIRHQLVRGCGAAGWAPKPVLSRQQVPRGALVVVFSPFLDDAVVDVAVHAVRRGNPVLAVDLLPDDLVPDHETEWGDAVLAVIAGEHRVRLAALRGQGVPVARWSQQAEVVEALRRIRRRGRVAVR
jgi:uncharacterized protein (DUF58 family)